MVLQKEEMALSDKKLSVIGIHEEVDFPKQDLENLASKTDTGAYNSAIDCCSAEVKKNKKGENVLHYILLNPNRKEYTGQVYKTKKFKMKTVRSSNGTVTKRYQVRLRIELKGNSFRTTFNLSNRSKMRYPVLLGRKFLANRFLVNVSRNRKVKVKSKT